MKSFSIRKMLESDLPGMDDLRRLAGWNQTPEDWRRMLGLQPEGCFVAIQDGQVVGTVTTTSYGSVVAWIGMMLVHPERRRQGIGIGLMRQALQYLQTSGLGCVRLDATPAGRPLYEKLGFVEEWSLTRWQRREQTPDTQVQPMDFASVRSLAPADWPVIDEIDQAAFGATRTALLRSLAQSARTALVWPARGRVEGWGLLRPGANSDYLGPLACSHPQGSPSLAAALLHAAHTRSVFWDIPDQNSAARTAAEEFGFSPVRPLTRMRLGPLTTRSASEAHFAIADPAVG